MRSIAWMQGGHVDPIDSENLGALFTPGGYHSFEHRWALAEAFTWQSGLGRDKVAARIHGLAKRLKDGIADHVRLVTPRGAEVSSGLVCFDVDGMEPEAAVERLASSRIRATITPYADRHVRLGTSLHVDERDVDAAVTAIKALQG